MEMTKSIGVARPPARVVVKESVYHELTRSGAQPTIYEPTPRSFALTTDDRPVEVDQTVGTEWSPINCRWLDRATMLMLANVEGEDVQRVPTREELADIKKLVVEVGVTHSTVVYGIVVETFAEVRPGDPVLRLRPTDIGVLQVRCPHGEARVRVVLIPE